jgi:hypothetical protein
MAESAIVVAAVAGRASCRSSAVILFISRS